MHIAQNFIRVAFCDENGSQLGLSTIKDLNGNPILKAIKDTLKNGLMIADKKFSFLAYSNSQLRVHSAWFFAREGDLTADIVRKELGEFSGIKNVAKFGARLG